MNELDFQFPKFFHFTKVKDFFELIIIIIIVIIIIIIIIIIPKEYLFTILIHWVICFLIFILILFF